MRLRERWSASAAILLLAAAPYEYAQALSVLPSRGTQATHFVVSRPTASCTCTPFPPQVQIDGNDACGGSSCRQLTLPCALDSVCFVGGGCNNLALSPGSHTIRVQIAGDCTPEPCFIVETASYTVLTHDPVLLVHGLCGDATDWDTFDQILSDSGFVVERLQYGSPDFSLPPKAYIPVLAQKIKAMDCDKVVNRTGFSGPT